MTRHPDHPCSASRLGRCAVAALLVLCGLTVANLRSQAGEPLDEEQGLPLERPDDPPALGTSLINATTPAAVITFGRFTSLQVNVNAAGLNVSKDAGNEPSMSFILATAPGNSQLRLCRG